MKIMRVDTRAGRAETESTEVLVLTHCEGGVLSKQATVIDKSMGGALDRKSTRLNSSHSQQSRMPSSA